MITSILVRTRPSQEPATYEIPRYMQCLRFLIAILVSCSIYDKKGYFVPRALSASVTEVK
jgi:hypothetical protein